MISPATNSRRQRYRLTRPGPLASGPASRVQGSGSCAPHIALSLSRWACAPPFECIAALAANGTPVRDQDLWLCVPGRCERPLAHGGPGGADFPGCLERRRRSTRRTIATSPAASPPAMQATWAKGQSSLAPSHRTRARCEGKCRLRRTTASGAQGPHDGHQLASMSHGSVQQQTSRP